MLLTFIGCAPKQKIITGYETKIIFVQENNYESNKRFNELTTAGWEIKSSRRAWTGSRRDMKWGTEYSMQKAIYSE